MTPRIALSATAVAGILAASLVAGTTAAEATPVGNCPDHRPVPGNADSLTVTAPAGQVITGYCVKSAGDKGKKGAPETVALATPVTSIVLRHTDGGNLTHYSLVLKAATVPTPEPEPAPEREPPAPPPAPPTVKAALLLCLGCLAINLLGRGMVDMLKIPLYLDMVGTAVAAIILGPWWGAGVGLSTNLLGVGISGYDSIPFAVVNVAGALVWGYGVRKFRMGTTVPRFFGLSAITALCCSVLAVPIILALDGQTGNGADDVIAIIDEFVSSLWLAVASANVITSMADKVISGAVALLAVDVLPWTVVASMRPLMPLAGSRPEPAVRSTA